MFTIQEQSDEYDCYGKFRTKRKAEEFLDKSGYEYCKGLDWWSLSRGDGTDQICCKVVPLEPFRLSVFPTKTRPRQYSNRKRLVH